ncbi:heterocyst frequency control protein PatD [Calothrix sp. 336/3]|uniref:heterocyst frequency control protein PatD n=1 Tax=Calothrix sp. 336/3 TaxID=1337936 RepID=UPI0004E38EBB|nr:heterocyst frequency control protein PatD [Calothrix sp. 336/3]AKG23595.1 hypothetical protein IJ00_21970 [Calothrix sp. 336/3]
MSSNLQKYHIFATNLEDLRLAIAAQKPDPLALRRSLTSLQQFFQGEIVPLAETDTESPNYSRVQSYRTEMSKQLRLLEMDVMFFQGAKQTVTAATRLQSIADRLSTLIRYCQAVVEMSGE